MSAPSMTSGRRGLFTVSSLMAKAGRRLAKPPSAVRSCSRPASGRVLGGRAFHLLPPTAPRKTASEASAAASVSAGSGVPSVSMAMPPMRFSSTTRSWPPAVITPCMTETASRATSGPIPSPATTSNFSFIGILFLLVDFGVGHWASVANLLRQQADQVLVVDVLFAIGESNEAIVGLLQLLARKRKAQLLQTMAQRGAAGVLAEYKQCAGRSDRCRRHDFVA